MKDEQSETTCNTALTDPAFLKELRVQMLKFAISQMRDETLAEDAVQDALMGALKNAKSFGRRSALKTWVFAILKNKIIDSVRKANRAGEVCQQTSDHQNDETLDDMLFGSDGRWHVHERPAAWVEPLDSIQSVHFWRVLEICLNDIPEAQARVFMMREFLELDSAEICENLNITTTNLHVMLYRARLRLRECLENKWFGKEETS